MKVEKKSLQYKTRFTEKAKQKVLKIRQQNRKVFIGLRGIYIQTAICNLSLEIEMEQDKES